MHRLLEQLIDTSPHMIDLELDLYPDLYDKCRKLFSSTQILISHHHYGSFPNVKELIDKLSSHPAEHYKLAIEVTTLEETIELLNLHKQTPSNWNIIPVGERFSWARAVRHRLKPSIEYLALEKPLAPGQLTIEALLPANTTVLYGLIGNPVEQSPSHITHNAVFAEMNVDALYTKILLEKEELAFFLSCAPEIGFKGLSVTIPFKEQVLSCLDQIDPEAKKIGAVNTITFEKGIAIGTNTDGKGALAPLESKTSVLGKRILLLGAGGAARAIAYEAIKRGANVTVTSRSAQRREQFAHDLSCAHIPWEKKECYRAEIIINATPDCDLELNIAQADLVLDINLVEGEFLRKAKNAISGKEMFIAQAVEQFTIWLKIQEKDEMYAILRSHLDNKKPENIPRVFE